MLQEDQPVQRIQEKPDQRLDNPLFGGSNHLRLTELLIHSTADGYGSCYHLNESLLDLNSGVFDASRADSNHRDSGHLYLLWRRHFDCHK